MGQDELLYLAVESLPLTEFVDRLPAYDTYLGNWLRLDPLRMMIDAMNYYPYILCYPGGDTANLSFSGFQTKEGSVQIVPGSYLLGITAFANGGVSAADNDGPGFKFSVTDKGSGLSLVERGFVHSKLLTGWGPDSANADSRRPFGPYWLDAPAVITRPGQIGISITNLNSTTSSLIQVALHLAYPVNNTSLNTPEVIPG